MKIEKDPFLLTTFNLGNLEELKNLKLKKNNSKVTSESDYFEFQGNRISKNYVLIKKDKIYPIEEFQIEHKLKRKREGEGNSELRDKNLKEFKSKKLLNKIKNNEKFKIEKLEVQSVEIKTDNKDLPPHNMETNEVKECYLINEIVSDKDKLTLFKEGYSSIDLPLIEDLLQKGKEKFVKEDLKKYLKKVEYLYYLMKLFLAKFQLSERDIQKTLNPNLHPSILEKLTSTFSELILRGQTKIYIFNHEKLLLHLLVLYLHLMDYSCSITTISETLKITQMDIQKYFREIGCSIKDSTASLRAPLRFKKLSKKFK